MTTKNSVAIVAKDAILLSSRSLSTIHPWSLIATPKFRCCKSSKRAYRLEKHRVAKEANRAGGLQSASAYRKATYLDYCEFFNICTKFEEVRGNR